MSTRDARFDEPRVDLLAGVVREAMRFEYFHEWVLVAPRPLADLIVRRLSTGMRRSLLAVTASGTHEDDVRAVTRLTRNAGRSGSAAAAPHWWRSMLDSLVGRGPLPA